MSASLSFELCGGGGGGGGGGNGFNFSSFQTRVTNGKRNTDAARVSSQGWMLCCSAVTHHLPICRLCLTCDPTTPPHPERHRSASFKPSSIIHPAALRPAARDWWTKEKRQTDEQGSRRRLRAGERESEGDANYSPSRALLRSYLSASRLTLNAAFRARVVSAVTDGNTSGKSSVVGGRTSQPTDWIQRWTEHPVSKRRPTCKKKAKTKKKPAFYHLTNRGRQKLLLKV